MRVLCASGLALMLLICGGCSSLFKLEAEQRKYYSLAVEAEPEPTRLPAADALRLLVREPRGEGFISSQRIIFQRDPVEQGYYQSASWVEPPTKSFHHLL